MLFGLKLVQIYLRIISCDSPHVLEGIATLILSFNFTKLEFDLHINIVLSSIEEFIIAMSLDFIMVIQVIKMIFICRQRLDMK